MKRKRPGARKKVRGKAQERSLKEAWNAWAATKSPVFRFGLKFCVLALFFCALSHAPFWKQPLSAYLAANARVSSAILNLLRQGSSFSDTTIRSAKFALTIDPSCTAFEFVWFACAAVLSFPAGFVERLLGILAATVAILALNVVRIVSLFLVGAHFAAIFDTVHLAIWPSLLVVATILLMVAWIKWSRRREDLPALAQ